VFLGVIAVAEFECTPKDADRVVIGFLTPRHIVGDFDEGRVPDIEESLGADPRTPESVEDPSIRSERDGCHIALDHTRGAVGEEGVKNLGASFRRALIWDFPQMAEIGKLLGKRECAVRNATLDSLEVLPCSVQAALAWRSQQDRAVSHALESEIEADSTGALWNDPARHRCPAHDPAPRWPFGQNLH
jgi:hypothetical protein